MKKLSYAVVTVIAGIIVLAGGGYTYILYALPDVGEAENIRIDPTPEMIQRGAYLANHVTVCIDCHSGRDWTKFSGPIKRGTECIGGEAFDHKLGLPGTFYAKNITPAGLHDWTDGEIYRLITTGVTRDGEPIFPIMPYQAYSSMDPEDVKAIIAYIRSLPALENQIEASRADFPMNLIMRTIPKKANPDRRPSTSDTLAYGRYITQIAGCADCHTPVVKGEPVEGMEFAGGFEFTFPNGNIVRSANITPDEETGIGFWAKETFLMRFKAYSNADSMKTVRPEEFNTPMPWTMYAGMTSEDLSAIYKYLRTLKPVKNPMERFTVND